MNILVSPMMPISPRIPLMSPLSRFNYSLPTTPTYQPSPGLPLGGYSPFSPHNPMTAPGLGASNTNGTSGLFNFEPEHIRAFKRNHDQYRRAAEQAAGGGASQKSDEEVEELNTDEQQNRPASQEANNTPTSQFNTSHGTQPPIRLLPVPNRKRSR